MGLLLGRLLVSDAASLGRMDESRRVALALGSGGARGYAHIGVIEVVEERGFEIAGVAGSSMGALVGGVWAAGKLAEFEGWARSLTRTDVLRMLDVSLKAPGAMRAEKVLAHVRELVGDRLIEELEAPFIAVATDLVSRREVWLQRGRLDVAIRASIALPGIFTPVMLNRRLLADGGLMDPIPVSRDGGARRRPDDRRLRGRRAPGPARHAGGLRAGGTAAVGRADRSLPPGSRPRAGPGRDPICPLPGSRSRA